VQVFHFFFGGRATLPICTVGQVLLRRVKVIRVDFLGSILIPLFLRPIVDLIDGGLEFH
jgi:hypothetical protein